MKALTVHVGITGHRSLPQTNIPHIKNSLECILRFIQQEVENIRGEREAFFRQVQLSEAAPIFRLIGSLASGADTLAAQVAQSLGYRLQVVLPFSKENYATDFTEGEERNNFETLLETAESVFEIAVAKKKEHSAPAYADASTIMLCHSDILIAIWDNKTTEYQAGTYATIREAKKNRIPVIIIPSENSGPIRFELIGAQTQSWEKGVSSHLTTILLPSNVEKDLEAKAEPAKLLQYLWIVYNKTFGRILKKTQIMAKEPLLFPIPSKQVRKKPQTCAEKIRDFFPSLVSEAGFRNLLLHRLRSGKEKQKRMNSSRSHDEEMKEAIAPVLECERTWEKFRMESLYSAGNYYGVVFKNHLFQQYFLPVLCMLSVIIALNFNNFSLGSAVKYLYNGHIGLNVDFTLSCILLVVQLISLVVLIMLFARENTQTELSRHTTYRLLSERCRQAVAVSASGFCRIFSPMKAWGRVHWVDWYFRLLARTDGVPNQQGENAVTRDYLMKWLNRLNKGFLTLQECYHSGRREKDTHINNVLHHLAILCFKASLYTSLGRIGVCLAYSYGYLPTEWCFLISLLGCLMLILPCFGMFFSAYANYANYPNQISVSTAMEQTCKTLKEETEALQLSNDLRFRDIVDVCVLLEERCAGEVSDWESNRNHDKSWDR